MGDTVTCNPVVGVGLAFLFLGLPIFDASAQIADGAFPEFTNIRVSNPSSTDPEEVTIAINPTNPLNLAAGANIRYYYYSNDGGLTWTQGNLTSTYGVWGDPVVIYDAQGYLYYGHLSNPPSPGYWIDRIVVNRSTTGGSTWNSGVGVGFNPPVRNQDKEWLAADMTGSPHDGNIYMSWTEFDRYGSSSTADSTRILFSRSTDAGLTWSNPVRLSEQGGDCIDEDNTVEGAVPAVGPNGEVYTAWSGPLGIMLDRSTDGGVTFGSDIFVTDQPGGWDFAVPGIYRCNGMPVTACDVSTSPYRGHVYVLWSDQRNGLGDTDVWLVTSTDGGATWGPRRRVNDDMTATHQFFPWLTIDQETGYLYAVFYDRRAVAGNATEVWMARSTDGGETFTNFRVSQSAFTPTAGVFFGDYTNIAALSGKVYPIWMRMDGTALSVWTALVTDSAEVTRQYPVRRGWNMVSVPMTVGDPRTTTLFPTADSEAFEYVAGAGYVGRDSLQPGVGYWIRFAADQSVGITGVPFILDTVDVAAGWNLIGSVEGRVPADGVTSVPPGIIQSAFSTHTDSGYAAADTLLAGAGYWVKVSSPGRLVLRAGDRDLPSGAVEAKPVRSIGKWH